MEEEIKIETTRSTCTGCVVRTEESLIVVENNGEVQNVHT